MREYTHMIEDYVKWYYKKTEDENYNPNTFFEDSEVELSIKKGKVWTRILELAYDKDEGIYWFHKFILGDLMYAGYPEPIRFNSLWWKWTKISKQGDHVAIECARQHGKCLSQHGTVTLIDGKKKQIKDINIGNKIISLNEKTLQQEQDIIIHKECVGIKPEYEITTNSGRTIKLADTHPLYTIDGWKKVKELNINDYLALPRKINVITTQTVSANEARFLGWLISEGYYSKNIRISQKNESCLKKISTLITKNFHIYKYKNTCPVITISKKGYRFPELEYKDSYNKFIPNEIFSQPDNIKYEFLSGLIEGDGYLDMRENGDKNIIYCTVSKQLAHDFQYLLQILGIQSLIRIKKSCRIIKKFNKKVPVYLIKINGINTLNLLQNMSFFSKEEQRLSLINKLKVLIHNTKTDIIPKELIKKHYNGHIYNNWSRECLNSRLIDIEKILNSNKRIRLDYKTALLNTNINELEKLSNANIFWDKIVNINYIKEELMYDIQVAKNKNFIADGFYSHNSTRWTVVEPIYRASMFEYYNILIESATEEQAVMLLGYAVKIIENNEFLSSKISKSAKWSNTEISYNGGKIAAKGVGSEVRGGTYDYIVCVPGETKIETICGEKRIDMIKAGDLVKTHTGKYKKVTRLFMRKERSLLEIKTKSHKIRMTPNHPLLTYDGWKPASEIKIGNTLQYPIIPKRNILKFNNKKITNRKQIEPIEINNEIAFILGLYAAEGCVRNGNTIAFTFNSNEKYLIDTVCNAFKRLNIKYYIDTHHNWATTVIIYSIAIYESFKQLFGKTAIEKKIPDIIFDLDERKKSAFILGLCEGDASKHKTGAYTFGSSSKRLRNDLVKLCKTLGITTTHISEYVCGKESFGESKSYRCYIGAWQKRKLTGIMDLTFDVESIRKVVNHTPYVFNIEVEDDNSYIANGIIVHNCDDILRTDNKLSDTEVENFIDEELEPMILVRGGQIVIVGTPKSDTDIFSTIDERISRGSNWKKYAYPAILDWDKKEVLCPDRFSFNQLLAKRDIMGRLKFDKEFMCQTYSSGTQLFPEQLRKKAMDIGTMHSLYAHANKLEQKEWSYYIGVDCARAGTAGGDYTVVTVIAYNSKTQVKKICWIWREKGLKISEQVLNIAEIAKNFDFPVILVEQNNIGQAFIDQLVDNFNLHVESFTTGSRGQAKDDLIRFLINAFEHEKIVMPMGDEFSRDVMKDLEQELSRFIVEITRAGNEVMKGSGHSHDDMVISLALANKATQGYGYSPFAMAIESPKSTTPLERFANTGDMLEVLKF